MQFDRRLMTDSELRWASFWGYLYDFIKFAVCAVLVIGTPFLYSAILKLPIEWSIIGWYGGTLAYLLKVRWFGD